MNKRPISFIPDPSEDEADFRPARDASDRVFAKAKEEVNSTVPARRPRPPAFKPCHSPKTLHDLLEIEDMTPILSKGFVFIHRKRSESDRLVEALQTDLGVCVRILRTHEIETDRLLLEIASPVSPDVQPVVFVIETTQAGEDVNRLCKIIAERSDRTSGVWLLGFIEDLDRKVLSRFNAMFVSDCSDSGWEVLRSAMDTSRANLYLRDRPSQSVLFFLGRGLTSEVPLLEPNPIMLDLS